MKAISLLAPWQVGVVDISEPRLGPEDVLVDIHYVGLCGSDLSAYRGHMPLLTYPRIPGHEVSGIVAARGDLVPESIAEGDRVTLSPYSHCGVCPACRVGRTNSCQFNQTLGVQRDGALSPRITAHFGKVHSSQLLSFEELALVEPMSVGYHAANRAQVSEIDVVLAIGCGTIGIGVVAAVARKGATVIALDIDDRKIGMARRFGASHTINSARQDPLSAVRELTNGEGVTVAIEAVGLPETYRLAVEAVVYAGRVVYVGYAKKSVTYDTTDFVRKELDIRGSRNALREFPAVIGMIEQSRPLFTELVTRTYPFNQAALAFQDWDAAPGGFTKILIDVRA